MRNQLTSLFMVTLIAVLAVNNGWTSEPELRFLTGHVTDAAGKPLPNALVEWAHFMVAHEDRQSVRTADDGSFRIETRKYGPDFRLGASSPGYSPAWLDAVIPDPADKPTPRTFRLLKPVELSGMVVDNVGKPIADATVIAHSESTGFYRQFFFADSVLSVPGAASRRHNRQGRKIRDQGPAASQCQRPRDNASHSVAGAAESREAEAQVRVVCEVGRQPYASWHVRS